jgi:TolB-like protein
MEVTGMEKKQFPKLTLILLAFLLGYAGGSWGQTEEQFEPIHVGVTPFVNITQNKEFDWLGIGISESLCTKLASLPYLTLVERTRLSEALKEMELGQTGLIDEATAAKTGQMAGAEELVVGSYQIIGQKIRINARFVDVEKGKIKKTAEATGNMDQIFDLQDQIAASFLDNLKLPITQEEKALVTTQPTESLEAYKLYSQAMDTYTPQGKSLDDEKRIELLNRSARIDPRFFVAFISLGDLYAKRRDESGYSQAATYYNRAVSIQPNYIAPRDRLVQVYQVQGNTAAVQREQQKIVEIKRTFTQSETGKEKIKVLQTRPPKPSVASSPPKPSPAPMQPQPPVKTAPPTKALPVSTASKPPDVTPPKPSTVSTPPKPSPVVTTPPKPPVVISPPKPAPTPPPYKPPVVSPPPKPSPQQPPPKAPVAKTPPPKPKPQEISKPAKPSPAKPQAVSPKPAEKPKKSKEKEEEEKEKRK